MELRHCNVSVVELDLLIPVEGEIITTTGGELGNEDLRSMKYSTSQKILVFISVLIFIAGLFAFTYATKAYTRSIERPFGLSNSYRRLFHPDPNISLSFSDLSSLNWQGRHDIPLTLISVQEDKIGLYDPQLYFSLDLHYIQAGTLRVFSMRDYIERKKVGYYLLKDPSDLPDLPKAQAKAGQDLEIINGIAEDSALYDKNKPYIINLTSMETIGPEIFIDGDPTEVAKWSRVLQQQGYQLGTTEKVELGEVFMVFLGRFNRVSIFLYLTIVFYILLLIAITAVELSGRRYAKIHSVCGGKGATLFFILHRDWIAGLIATGLIFTLFFSIGTRQQLFESISPAGFAWYTLSHIGAVTVASFLFHQVGLKMTQGRREP